MNGQLVYVRDTQCHYKLLTRPSLFSRSSITMSGLMLISSILFTWVLCMTLVDLRWMPNGVHMAKVEYLTAPELSLKCTMWIFNQVLSKVLSIFYRVVFSVFLITLL